MCDTIVATQKATSDGSIILAKNSDRDVNEGHALVYYPRQKFDPENDKIKTTHNLEIPQVEETNAIVLSAPYWLYGGEMGSNEYGVTIGNEAVFTKEPEREKGLLGMDLLRIALERARTAVQALDIIVELIQTYGQGGNASPFHKMNYHNSFIIADPREAWVLETADRFWIAEKVKKIRTISNTLTIESKFDKIHPLLIEYAIKKGYCKSRKEFNFRKAFKAGLPDYRDWGGKGKKRHELTTKLLTEKEGDIDPSYMMRVLRTHNDKKKKTWNPSKGSFECICVHARPIFVPSQTTSSMVSHLLPDLQTHWITGTAGPCTSLFKPVFVEAGLSNIGPRPMDKHDTESLWWRHEVIHRSILRDYETRIKIIRPDIEYFEEQMLKKVKKLRTEIETLSREARLEKLAEISHNAFNEALELESKWLKDLKKVPVQKKTGGFFYRRFWKNENKKAEIPDLI
ncbi:MAG: C69 family dipeptidase [Candidatus Hodarchaeales archaeon]